MSRKRLLYVLAGVVSVGVVSWGVYRYGGRVFGSDVSELKPFPLDELKPYPRNQVSELKPYSSSNEADELKPFSIAPTAPPAPRTARPTATR
jgi:hypothetical protein